MPMTMHVDVVSAEESIYSGTALMIAAPAEGGEVGVYAGHTQMLARLHPGELRILEKEGADPQPVFVSGGILEVQPYHVTVLADTAVRAKDLDEAEALEAKKRAEEALENSKADFDYAKAQAELVEAAARLQMIQKLRRK
ncbi:F0F1 ATP synthase subunit epsilon [Thioalkalivibrio sp. HL-Eb18]|uniref:F0F1 ATP synthase subunit epsilon n=1 Tax=Thioalkalivibrio sp. HL-Eb18 TaxID=1266913 RepID=UPI000368C964|nr:F0F1 ATP synthase subunit epsilon [Thioalkalivibrio sp. HL-Eb18]